MRDMPELAVTEMPVGDLVPYAGNAKEHPESQVDEIAASIAEFGNCDPIGVWHDADGNAQIVEGHGRLLALRKLGIETAPVIFLDHLTDEQRRAYSHVHNQTTLSSGFDMDALCADMAALDFDWESLGFTDVCVGQTPDDLVAAAIERDDRPADDEYDEFTDKFRTKLTTDDCFTPVPVYGAVAKWACEEYGIDRSRVVRPFYPGGDYECFEYPDGCVVIDNPPFSIFSEIMRFYVSRGIDFFLFAPGLTIFSSHGRNDHGVNYVIAHAHVIYENGADVCTSFATSLGERFIMTSVALHDAIEGAQESREPIAKYEYPDEVITSSNLGWICSHGFDVAIDRESCSFTRCLDSQRESGKTIYGGGFLLSEKAAAEKAAAEKAAAEKAAARVWELSDRELAIVEELS